MRLLAIDPGNEQSAAVMYDTETRLPMWWTKDHNEYVRGMLDGTDADALAVEHIASYGMAVGATVFETCVAIGRFVERWLTPLHGLVRPEPIRVYRADCKLHLCHSRRAKDGNIRQALIDRYGPSKQQAIGLKASPGPLYGMSGDCWSALAVAVTTAETLLAPAGEAAAA